MTLLRGDSRTGAAERLSPLLIRRLPPFHTRLIYIAPPIVSKVRKSSKLSNYAIKLGGGISRSKMESTRRGLCRYHQASTIETGIRINILIPYVNLSFDSCLSWLIPYSE